MIKDVLQSVANVEIFPVISLILFLIAFLYIIIRVLRMDKKDLDSYSRMPLEDSELTEPIAVPVEKHDDSEV